MRATMLAAAVAALLVPAGTAGATTWNDFPLSTRKPVSIVASGTAIWVAEQWTSASDAGRVVSISASGAVNGAPISTGAAGGVNPRTLALGSDGSVWWTAANADEVDRWTPGTRSRSPRAATAPTASRRARAAGCG